MYLLNYLSLQAARQIFISADRYRTGVGLTGAIDGVNQVFTTPGNQKFVHNLPFLTLQLYYNSQRLILIDDYFISESAGPGTGYDTVILIVTPKAGDKIHADYVLHPT